MFAQFRFAARSLLRWRGGAAVAVLTLGIGTGAATGLYALARLALADLPGVPRVDRVARIYASNTALGVDRSPVTLHELNASLKEATTFAAVGGYVDQDVTIGTGADARPVIAGHASAGFFQAMGVPPAAGRVLVPEDDEPSRPVVMLSDALCRRQFGDGDCLSRTLTVDGVERMVIGVMPADFRFAFLGVNADLWIPLEAPGPEAPAIVAVYARLRDGVPWSDAAAELRGRSRGREPWAWRAIPVDSDARHRAAGAYALTLGPALLVLLLACANVACLLMARGVDRQQELGVRRALGATRAQLIRLLIVEHAALTLAGGALGAGMALVLLRALAAALNVVQPSMAARLIADVRLLPVALAASAAACLLFGILPAVRLSRAEVVLSLKGSVTMRRAEIDGYGARDIVVFVETASAAGLIVWAAMVLTFFAQLQRIAVTFPADEVVALRAPGRETAAIAARLSAVPGVVRTASSTGMLLSGALVRVESSEAPPLIASLLPAGEGFFDTLGVPILRGRGFDTADERAAAPVVVLSQSAAARLGRDPVGMRVRIGRAPVSTVIGICRDAIDYGALSRVSTFAPPEIYVPRAPGATETVILARVAGDGHRALNAIRDAAGARPGERPIRPLVLSDEMRARSRDTSPLTARVLAAFAVLTLLLAASGIFAVVSQSVALRGRELGIRIAVGAPQRQVLGMVLAREAKLIGAAVISGVVFATAASQALFAELVTVTAILPSLWIGGVVVSAAVAALACVLAAWRIVRLDPSRILQNP